MRVVALIPAHNEQDRIGQAIASLIKQSVGVSRIIVVSDNSTDNTIEIAKSWGSLVEVFETVDNTHKKSGALNQAFAWLEEDDESFVLVMDADTEMSPQFIEHAIKAFVGDVGAVGGIFIGDGQNGVIGDCQGLEYVRYAREIGRDKARAKVLTGTSTFARLGTFREVERARQEGKLPGTGVYNSEALTEDFELTICLKTLGYKTVSPKQCVVVTETMPTMNDLWKQRLRWQRGALQTLHMHGWNTVTRPYILRQIETGLGLFFILTIWLVTLFFVLNGEFTFQPLWLGVGVVFYLERIVSAWRGGWKYRLLAGTFVLDFLFDMFIGIVYLYAGIQAMKGQGLVWGSQTIDERT